MDWGEVASGYVRAQDWDALGLRFRMEMHWGGLRDAWRDARGERHRIGMYHSLASGGAEFAGPTGRLLVGAGSSFVVLPAAQ